MTPELQGRNMYFCLHLIPPCSLYIYIFSAFQKQLHFDRNQPKLDLFYSFKKRTGSQMFESVLTQ